MNSLFSIRFFFRKIFVGYKYPTYVETEQYTWIGFSNPTFQSFPNFRNVWTSAFLSDTSIRPASKPKNPCRSDSRIRHSNHSRISAIYGHRFFRRIQVSNRRRNRKIHVGRILESDIPIIPEFSQYVDIGFFRRIQVSDLRQNRTIHVGRILESDISIIPEFSQCVDIGSLVGYKYPTDVETEKSMWVGFSNPTFQSFPNFLKV